MTTHDIHVDLAPMFKARAAEENGERVIYCEASNAEKDQQGERVMQKALAASRDYFLSRGVIDLDHRTLVGHRQGIANPYQYEIGRPVEVKCDPGRTFVKGVLYKGGNALADFVWKSLTEWSPPKRWFPSVGGACEKSADGVIETVRWNNLALTSEPVNHTVAEVAIVPFGEFAKSFAAAAAIAPTPEEQDALLRGLEAGYGTDKAALVGGGSLRKESLHGAAESDSARYRQFCRSMYADLANRDRQGCGHLSPVSREGLAAHAVQCLGVARGEADDFITRFLRSGRRAA